VNDKFYVITEYLSMEARKGTISGEDVYEILLKTLE
jgi:hypothetical protein